MGFVDEKMASFQVIFSGNEDELYRFVITWKMMSEVKRYEDLKKQVEELEQRLKDLRKDVRNLEERKRKLEKEVNELEMLRESVRRGQVKLGHGEIFSNL
ncbi:MAG: hypothetical protein DRN68_08295 [Thaumarchaeota archaeon]|nr:MAG: hypothetical protein DRN68_08295 [Nitrososphaerota archaeon]